MKSKGHSPKFEVGDIIVSSAKREENGSRAKIVKINEDKYYYLSLDDNKEGWNYIDCIDSLCELN